MNLSINIFGGLKIGYIFGFWVVGSCEEVYMGLWIELWYFGIVIYVFEYEEIVLGFGSSYLFFWILLNSFKFFYL